MPDQNAIDAGSSLSPQTGHNDIPRLGRSESPLTRRLPVPGVIVGRRLIMFWGPRRGSWYEFPRSRRWTLGLFVERGDNRG